MERRQLWTRSPARSGTSASPGPMGLPAHCWPGSASGSLVARTSSTCRWTASSCGTLRPQATPRRPVGHAGGRGARRGAGRCPGRHGDERHARVRPGHERDRWPCRAASPGTGSRSHWWPRQPPSSALTSAATVAGSPPPCRWPDGQELRLYDLRDGQRSTVLSAELVRHPLWIPPVSGSSWAGATPASPRSS